jgi:hypothetical protein
MKVENRAGTLLEKPLQRKRRLAQELCRILLNVWNFKIAAAYTYDPLIGVSKLHETTEICCCCGVPLLLDGHKAVACHLGPRGQSLLGGVFLRLFIGMVY